jgi:hypothetical protein
VLFKQFIELAHPFDPALADLYADAAHLVSVRKYPGGMELTLKVHSADYKPLIRGIILVAKAHRDISTYGDAS